VTRFFKEIARHKIESKRASLLIYILLMNETSSHKAGKTSI